MFLVLVELRLSHVGPGRAECSSIFRVAVLDEGQDPAGLPRPGRSHDLTWVGVVLCTRNEAVLEELDRSVADQSRGWRWNHPTPRLSAGFNVHLSLARTVLRRIPVTRCLKPLLLSRPNPPCYAGLRPAGRVIAQLTPASTSASTSNCRRKLVQATTHPSSESANC